MNTATVLARILIPGDTLVVSKGQNPEIVEGIELRGGTRISVHTRMTDGSRRTLELLESDRVELVKREISK